MTVELADQDLMAEAVSPTCQGPLRRAGDILGRIGQLETRLARTNTEIDAAQAVRYRVFVEEMNAQIAPDAMRRRRDIDAWDMVCDHLLVLDTAIEGDAEVRERPAESARVVGRLAKKQKVDVLARQGNWTRIRGPNASGWVRLLDVRFDAPPAGAVSTARVRSGRGDGIRGFSEEDLLAGTPGHSELGKLKKYAVTPRDASSFARGAGLKARPLDYLDPMEAMAFERLPEDFFDE